MKEIELKEMQANEYMDFAVKYLNSGDIDSAADIYIECIKKYPTYQHAYRTLLNLNLKNNKLLSIVEDLKKIIEKYPNSALAHVSLAEAYGKLGMIKEATIANIESNKKHKKIIKKDFFEKHWNNGKVKGPNFIIIGAEKSGTSSLYESIIMHPKIIGALIKEPHFFSHKINNGIEWYLSHFPPIPDNLGYITGEASTSYFHNVSMNIPQKIKGMFPDVKLILILRDPVQRAISQYNQERNLGNEKRSFRDAILEETAILGNGDNLLKKSEKFWGNGQKGYIWTGLYSYHIKEWLKFFKVENIMIIDSREFDINTTKVIMDVFEFLGLEKQDIPTKRVNIGQKNNMITEDEINIARAFFIEPNKRLNQEYGINFLN